MNIRSGTSIYSSEETRDLTWNLQDQVDSSHVCEQHSGFESMVLPRHQNTFRTSFYSRESTDPVSYELSLKEKGFTIHADESPTG